MTTTKPVAELHVCPCGHRWYAPMGRDNCPACNPERTDEDAVYKLMRDAFYGSEGTNDDGLKAAVQAIAHLLPQ